MLVTAVAIQTNLQGIYGGGVTYGTLATQRYNRASLTTNRVQADVEDNHRQTTILTGYQLTVV